MRFLHVVAGFFLFFELPIPIYWLILHPFGAFWRNRVRAAFWIAGLTAWTVGGALLWIAFALDMGPDVGWFAYVPLSGPQYGAGKRADRPR